MTSSYNWGLSATQPSYNFMFDDEEEKSKQFSNNSNKNFMRE